MELTGHRISKLVVGKIHQQDADTFVREIVIAGRDDTFTITLFGKTQKDLEIIESKEHYVPYSLYKVEKEVQ